MNSFQPFVGTRYNTQRVRIAEVVSPPYDVISSEEREHFYENNPYNVIRLELNHDDDPYASAAGFFHSWIEEDILRRDTNANFYVYYQTFLTPEGEQVTRRGVLGKLKVSQYSEGNVLPHERTMPKAKQDRFALLEASGTQFSPIFGLIDDSALVLDHTIDSVTAYEPLADVDEVLATGAHIRHTLWRLNDPPLVARIQTLVSTKQIVIADGHHRYETAVAFSEAHPKLPGADHIMIYLANLRAEGTVILPTHRILYGVPSFDELTFLAELEKQFTLQISDSREAALVEFEADERAFMLVGFHNASRWVVVSDNDADASSALERLGVYRLHERILKQIAGLTQAQIDAKTNLLYPHTLPELDAIISKHPYNAVFILKPITADEMMNVTKEGKYMPQKSTFFYPKLLSGLVFHEFSAQSEVGVGG